MAEKLLLFGIGYVLGTRAGRERFDQLVDAAKQLYARDEVKMAVGLAMGFVEDRTSRLAGAPQLRRVA